MKLCSQGDSISKPDEWLEGLKGLWQNSPIDFDVEMEFNKKSSEHHPHCCICALFVPFKVRFRSTLLYLCPVCHLR